jgi:hypothetical protein
VNRIGRRTIMCMLLIAALAVIWTFLGPRYGNEHRQVARIGYVTGSGGLAAITGSPSVDQLVIIAEDAITMRPCSRIDDGKQMLADSLCFFEIHASADHPINNHRALVLEF